MQLHRTIKIEFDFLIGHFNDMNVCVCVFSRHIRAACLVRKSKAVDIDPSHCQSIMELADDIIRQCPVASQYPGKVYMKQTQVPNAGVD